MLYKNLFLNSLVFMFLGDWRDQPHVGDELDTYRIVPESH